MSQEADVAPMLSALLEHKNLKIKVEAADVIKLLATAGGHFGGGLLNFRQKCVEARVIERCVGFAPGGVMLT